MAFRHHDPLTTSKAIIALLILMIGLFILVIFKVHGVDLAMNGQLTMFKILAIVEGALLLTLLYLVNQTQHQVKAKSSSKKKK